jgi:hypothetical protein
MNTTQDSIELPRVSMSVEDCCKAAMHSVQGALDRMNNLPPQLENKMHKAAKFKLSTAKRDLAAALTFWQEA